MKKRKRTGAGGKGRGGHVAGGGESEGLGDIEGDAELGAVLEGVAEAGGVALNHRLQAGAARPLRLLRRAVRRHERQAVHHVRHQARAVRCRGRRRLRRRESQQHHAQQRECEEGSCHFRMTGEREREREIKWRL